MKNTDIAAVILIASLSVVAAYVFASALIGKPGSETVKVKTIEPISAEITEPDKTVFNEDAINPTVEVIIGDSATNAR